MSSENHRPITVTAVTASLSAVLIRGQLRELRSRGFEPILVSSPGEEVETLVRSEGARLVPVPMRREPSPGHDLIALARVVRLFARLRPELVNAGTPKAGLLCIFAAWATGVPVRIYTLHGLRHESLRGWRRTLQKIAERIACALANKVVCVSPSLKELAISEGILPPEKAIVLGRGSCGIELDEFQPDRITEEDRAQLRAELGIPPEGFVVGFVGRLIPRKGIAELLAAWDALRDRHPRSWLVLVGPREAAQPLVQDLITRIESDERVLEVGLVHDVARYMSIMDVLALPAHWEGFGNVLVEAAAMEVPVITTDGTGTQDAVSDGVNGRIVPVGDVAALTAALTDYLLDSVLRESHGAAGRTWAAQFDRQLISMRLADLYEHLLARPIMG